MPMGMTKIARQKLVKNKQSEPLPIESRIENPSPPQKMRVHKICIATSPFVEATLDEYERI
jgi:hypothetical protein